MTRLLRILLLLAVLAPCLHAGVPNLIDFQGSLVDENGIPVTGTPTIRFALYPVNTGGEAIWSETKQVVLVDGVYSTQLGDATPLTDNIWENDQLWLGIKVEQDDEMIPRVRIVAVPYAMRAKVAEEVVNAGGALFFVVPQVFNEVRYNGIHDWDGMTATSDIPQTIMPRNGEIRNLTIWPYHGYALPDYAVVATVRVNGVDTALTVTHTTEEGRNAVINTSDRILVNQGDGVSLKHIGVNGTPDSGGVLGMFAIGLEIR